MEDYHDSVRAGYAGNFDSKDYYINPTDDASSLTNPISDIKLKSPEKKQQFELKNPNFTIPIVNQHNPVENQNNNTSGKRILKYFIEALVVALIAYYFVGKNKLSAKDAVILGLSTAVIFAVLDIFYPTNC